MSAPEVLEGFIVLEGIDGAGTTTQLNRLADRFRAAGRSVFATCEPTPGPIGTLIRKALSGEAPCGPRTLALLFAADRTEHVEDPAGGIRARLRRGEVVISDRYLYSSLAYQSVECGFDYVLGLNNGFPLPAHLVYLEISVEIGDRRYRTRPTKDIYENMPFQSKVAAMYERALDRFGSSGTRIHRVDGTLPADQVTEKIWSGIFDAPIQEV